MSYTEEEQSPNPRFWLEFRTFDDGHSTHNVKPLTPSLTAFPQFSLLPAELRLKIWSNLIQPRIVVACCLQSDERLPERQRELDARTRGAAIPVLENFKAAVRNAHFPAARVWFNFNLDAMYLTGELEAYDSYGFNSPMVYFMRREDMRRVKHIACAFSELGYPQQESDQIFGCLWHVVDGFQTVERLLLTVDDKDEEVMRGNLLLSTDNVMQKIWTGWMCGTTVTSSRMADKQMLLVREEDLVDFIASH
ncbi:hypothetical protein G7046_g9754 [Stylonectria norvegica]|nr:hypothetical protein G7046_g9754 [Stylonectria norvegica]